jgi:hypothetical protein
LVHLLPPRHVALIGPTEVSIAYRTAVRVEQVRSLSGKLESDATQLALADFIQGMHTKRGSEPMTDDLLSARESFYRRFVVIGAAVVGHLLIMLTCLALTLVGKAIFPAVAVFVVGHVVLIAAFHAAWTS